MTDNVNTPPATPAAQTTTADIPTRPEHIPEKFWDAEKGTVRVDDLVKSYTELESKASKPVEPQVPDPNAAPVTPEGDPVALREKATKEIEESGTLSEETYAAYEKVGITRDQIAVYLAGQEALGNRYVEDVYKETGGADNYAKMIQWAAANYTPDEIAAYDSAVYGNDPKAGIEAAKALAARYNKENGMEGSLIVGDNDGNSGDLFESKADLTAAMRDPKYAKDASYRQQIQEKLNRSLRAGKKLGI